MPGVARVTAQTRRLFKISEPVAASLDVEHVAVVQQRSRIAVASTSSPAAPTGDLHSEPNAGLGHIERQLVFVVFGVAISRPFVVAFDISAEHDWRMS